jgi:hypothetical protein
MAILDAAALDALAEGQQVRDQFRDILTKRGGMWHSYETAPMSSAKVAKWNPILIEPSA